MKMITYWLIQEIGNTTFLTKTATFRADREISFIGRISKTGELLETKILQPK